MLRSISLTPYIIKNIENLNKIKSIQPIFNKLWFLVSRDKDWILDAFSQIESKCAWTRRELLAYKHSYQSIISKPALLLSNSVYLSPENSNDVIKFLF